MARQNRWATFGQAFNAVYDVGTTLGKSIESGKIAIKDYEDEEGKKLTGLALDRAKMDDYAAVEQKYGDPMEALRMRTGVETLGQNRLKTDYDTDTYDARVYLGGDGAVAKLDAGIGYTKSATGLNNANAGRVNLDTEIRGRSKDNEVLYNTARFKRDTAQAAGQTTAFEDKSFAGGLIAAQKSAEARDNADTTRFGSPEYAASLKATDNQNIAEATLARTTADLNNTVMTDKIYQANFIAAEKAKMGATATMLQIEEQMANDPRTRQLADEQLQLTLNNTMTAVKNAQTDLNLASSADFQAARFKSGLSVAEAGAVQGEEAVLLAQQSLAANTFIKEWSKTGNPDDPTSMRNLIKGISQINPVMGQKLSQDYGEHELWEITNRSLRMKAETNEALQKRGAAGAQEILDKYNGEDFGIRIDTNPDDGSMSMVETDKDGNVVRTIASGADERAFMQDLNAALDPASLMEYSMNLVDMDYKRALTQYSEAQAKAAGVGKPMSAVDMAYRTMVNTEASAADRKLATAFLMRESPDLYAQIMETMDFQSILDAAGDGDVEAKLTAPVVVDGEQTEAERTTAESVMNILAAPSSTADQRAKALEGDNRKLVEKYFGADALAMEDNKSGLVSFMELELSKGRVTLTPDGMDELAARYQRASEVSVGGGHGGKSRKAQKQTLQTYARLISEQPTEILQILIGAINAKIKPETGGGHSGRTAKANNKKYRDQLAELENLIAAMDGR